MSTVDELIKVMQYIIGTALAVRLSYCLLKIATKSQERDMYIKRSINALIFLVLAITANDIKDLIVRYYR